MFIQRSYFIDVPETTYIGVKVEDINLVLTVLLILSKGYIFFKLKVVL